MDEMSEQDFRVLRRLFSTRDSLYCILGFDGRFRKISGQWSALLGLTESEIYHCSLLDLVHPEDQRESIRAFSRLSSPSPETILYEGRLRCADGGYRWFSWHTVSEPESRQIYALAIDITERKRLQELVHVTLEAAPVGILMTDMQGGITLCNRMIERQFGYDRNELVGQSVDMLVPERFRDRHVQERGLYLRNPESRQMGANRELFGLRKDGFEFPVEIGLHPVETAEGRYILSMVVDISERYNAAKLLERQANIMEVAEQTAGVGGWEYDLDTGELYWTPQTFRIHALSPKSYTPTIESAREFIAPEWRAVVEENFRRLARGEGIDSEFRLVDAEGQARDVRVIARVHREDDGSRRVYGSIQDITQIKQAHADLVLRDRCLENASDGIVISDPNQEDNPVIYCNQGFTRLTGYPKSEVIGRNCRFLQGEATDPAAVAEIREAIRDRRGCLVTLKNYRKDGSPFWNQLSITPVLDDRGMATHFIGVQTDVSDSVELSQELAYQASHDPLTDLINRREFERRLEQALYRAGIDNSRHVMCYVDMDNFKVVNDTAGHIAGDELLRQMPALFRRHVRAGDSVARLGGDEFGLLLENCSLGTAENIVRQLVSSIDEFRFFWDDRTYRISASIGIVEVASDAGSVTELLKKADAACYSAKEGGGNRYYSYQMDDQDIERRQSEMESVNLILQGIDQDRFYLDYQTVRSLNAPPDPGEHFEVLLRLRSAAGNSVLPARFLPAAERFHIAPRLDRWVVDRVFATLRRRPEYLEKLFLCAINLSGLSINDPDFQHFVEQKLDEYAIPGSKIIFEITETAAIGNLGSAIRFMEGLKKRGCCFSLDDFGSGLSSFGYLATLPVDFVKIDGQFIRDLDRDPVHRAMARSIHEIATIMGKQSIAEFVENAQIASELQQFGVNYMQGYGIARPQPLDTKYPA